MRGPGTLALRSPRPGHSDTLLPTPALPKRRASSLPSLGMCEDCGRPPGLGHAACMPVSWTASLWGWGVSYGTAHFKKRWRWQARPKQTGLSGWRELTQETPRGRLQRHRAECQAHEAPALRAAQRTARRTRLGPRQQEPSRAHRLDSRADACRSLLGERRPAGPGLPS